MTEAEPLQALSAEGSIEDREAQYHKVLSRLQLLLEGETDWVAAMATVACELHAAFAYYNWTGFYQAHSSTLVVGPYQGSLGCLRIPFNKGVCGAAARSLQTQLVPDVHQFPGHIACASSTQKCPVQSEVVVPVVRADGRLLAVLDIDSDLPAAFTPTDAQSLEELCCRLAAHEWKSGLPLGA